MAMANNDYISAQLFQSYTWLCSDLEWSPKNRDASLSLRQMRETWPMAFINQSNIEGNMSVCG